MISKKTKKILIKSAFVSILLILSVFVCANFVRAEKNATVGQNPLEKRFNFPWSEASGISGLVKQIYLIALGLVGALALGMIVFGGVQYAASAGNPSRQTDARDRITQAIWGVVLLLCAYLIFNTINPDLLKLKEPGAKELGQNNPAKNSFIIHIEGLVAVEGESCGNERTCAPTNALVCKQGICVLTEEAMVLSEGGKVEWCKIWTGYPLLTGQPNPGIDFTKYTRQVSSFYCGFEPPSIDVNIGFAWACCEKINQ